IDVVDVLPTGQAPYVESVVGGSMGDVHLSNPPDGGFLGISPNICEPIDRAVNFIVSDDICQGAGCDGAGLKFLCETVAQESGHSFGLEHSYDCRDPMTYLGDCGPKQFLNEDIQCGEFMPRACKCSTLMVQNT